MKKVFILLSLLIGFSILYSCSDDNFPEEEETEIPEEPTIPEDPGDSEDDPLNPNSQDINYENAVTIAFSSSGVTIDNPFNGNGVEIENNESHVIIRSMENFAKFDPISPIQTAPHVTIQTAPLVAV